MTGPQQTGGTKTDPQPSGGTNGPVEIPMADIRPGDIPLDDIPLGDDPLKDDPPREVPMRDIPMGDDGTPVFAAPWEASAFALAVRLAGEGYFTWDEWANALSEEILAAQRDGDPDLGDTYYRHWLRALERLCRERGLVSPEEASDRKKAWRRAYLDTPHGKPVELAPHRHTSKRNSSK